MTEMSLTELELATAIKYREDLNAVSELLSTLSEDMAGLHMATATYDTPYRSLYQRMISTVSTWQSEAATLVSSLPIAPE